MENNNNEEVLGIPFEEALIALKEGKKIFRNGWKNKITYLVMNDEVPYWFTLDRVQDTMNSAYSPKIIDIMAEDWAIID